MGKKVNSPSEADVSGFSKFMVLTSKTFLVMRCVAPLKAPFSGIYYG